MRLGKIEVLSLLAILILSACGGGDSSTDKNDGGIGDIGANTSSLIEILSPAEGITTPFSFITLEVNASQYLNVTAVNDTISKDYNRTIVIGGVENYGLKYLYNIPLTKGVNEINVTAQTDDAQIVSKLLRITSEDKDSALRLAFSKYEDTHTLNTQIDIRYKLLFEPSEYMLDSDGDGKFEEKAAFKKILNVTYNTLGHFTAMATLRTVNNILYSSVLNTTDTVFVHENYSKVSVSPLNGIKVVDMEHGLESTLYILAEDGKIYHFDQMNNEIINTITLEGVSDPQGFSIEDDVRLFIADTGNNRVAIFEKADGVFKENPSYFKNYQFVEGTEELEFKKIIDVAGRGESSFGSVMVLDFENNKLVDLTTYENKVVMKLRDFNNTELGNLNHPINIATGGNILDSGNRAIRGSSGKLVFQSEELANTGKLFCYEGCLIADKQKNQLLYVSSRGISKRIPLEKTPLMASEFVDINTNIVYIYVAYEEGGFERLSYDPDANGGQPEDIVNKFIAALQKNDYAEMRRYCSSKRAMEKENLDTLRAIVPYITHFKSSKDITGGGVVAFYTYEGKEYRITFYLYRDRYRGRLLIGKYQ